MNIIDLMAEAIEQGWSFDRIDKELYPLIKQAQKDRLVGYMLKEELDDLFKQPEQEPVIGTKTWFEDGKVVTQHLHPSDIYTTPPQRTWVGLTDEEVSGLWEMAQIFNQPKHFYLLVEAKLKEKNT